MPWGEGPGDLPPLRAPDGAMLVRLARAARRHEVVAADAVDAGPAQDAWRRFADLMRDLAEAAPPAGPGDLAPACDAALAALRARGARVLAGSAGGILYVAVLPRGAGGRAARYLFARG